MHEREGVCMGAGAGVGVLDNTVHADVEAGLRKGSKAR